jgi:hypothetical protein
MAMCLPPFRQPQGRLQPALDIPRVDAAKKGVDGLRQRIGVRGAQRAVGNRRGDRRHRRDGVLDRREGKPDRPLAPRRRQPLQTEPQRGGVAVERQLDRAAGQRCGFGIEQRLGNQCRIIPPPRRPPRRIARFSFPEPPVRPASRFLLHLILQEIYMHPLSPHPPAPPTGTTMWKLYHAIMAALAAAAPGAPVRINSNYLK